MCGLGKRWLFVLVAFAFVLALGGESYAGFGQAAFARALNVGPLRHAGRGPEVVFRTSGGRATKAQAIAAWRASKAGHAELLAAGKITRIVCRGRACVGR